MRNYICVYDFETDSADPSTCEPVQIASCILNPASLEIIENSEFSSFMRPEDIDESSYYDDHKDTIRWHAKNYVDGFTELSSKEQEEETVKIYEKWKDSPTQEQIFTEFASYLSKYHTTQKRQSMFTAPIRAGHNIRNFDDVILLRKCKKFGLMNTKNTDVKIFHPRDSVDIKELAFLWFESLSEPKAYNMDELRRFFGMSTHGAHDALNDIRDEALVIQKFMRLHRATAPKVKFKGAMREKVLA